jgi:hypothetical protein
MTLCEQVVNAPRLILRLPPSVTSERRANEIYAILEKSGVMRRLMEAGPSSLNVEIVRLLPRPPARMEPFVLFLIALPQQAIVINGDAGARESCVEARPVETYFLAETDKAVLDKLHVDDWLDDEFYRDLLTLKANPLAQVQGLT